jgi:hypothetical protein
MGIASTDSAEREKMDWYAGEELDRECQVKKVSWLNGEKNTDDSGWK